jgi:hypothetical protein
MLAIEIPGSRSSPIVTAVGIVGVLEVAAAVAVAIVFFIVMNREHRLLHRLRQIAV